MFWGGIKRDQWHEIGWIISLRSAIVFQTIVSEFLLDLVNDLGFYKI